MKALLESKKKKPKKKKNMEHESNSVANFNQWACRNPEWIDKWTRRLRNRRTS